MNDFSILNKGNSIEINFVIHSKFDIIPIFLCNKSMWRSYPQETTIKPFPTQKVIDSSTLENHQENVLTLWTLSLTSDWRQCCTFSSNIQMSPWFELSSINNFTFHWILCLRLNHHRHHTTYIVHQVSKVHWSITCKDNNDSMQ